jgi:homoserine kinase type II
MAVYTHLEDRDLRHHIRSFRLGELIKARGVSAGTINTIYELQTTRGRFILRILENRAVSEALFEEALLAHLSERELPVPKMVAGRRGSVVSIAARQQLSVFEFMPGRELGVFEVGASHARQVGAFLGKMHLAARSLGRRRRNRFAPVRMQRIAAICQKAGRREPQRLNLDDIEILRAEIGRHDFTDELPQGVVHGDMFIDNVRFVRGKLAGVLDFEMASTGPLVYDIAVALDDWAFTHDRVDLERAAALVAGYESERPLVSRERAALYDMCRFAAARFALTRFYDFEVLTRPEATRLYKDYRHFSSRLASLRALGAVGFRNAVLERTEEAVTGRS